MAGDPAGTGHHHGGAMAGPGISERNANQKLSETEPAEPDQWESELKDYEDWLDQLEGEYPEHDWTGA